MNKYGFDNFDIIYIINLKHRVDRWDQIISEMAKMNIDNNKIVRIDGVYHIVGQIGCTLAHYNTMKHFVNTPDNIKNCLVLEDDFEFTHDKDFVNNLLNKFFTNNINYDVLLLSSNIIKGHSTDYDFITKIIDAQTTSSYCTTKNFAPKLIDIFYDSSQKLLSSYNLYNTINSHTDAVDMIWKKLQPIHNWYCVNPKIGQQRASYSDIEKKSLFYGC
jgi:glycosyl transferase family 25